MRRTTLLLLSLIFVSALNSMASAQKPSAQHEAQAQTAFETANSLLERGKPAEALTHYKQALAILPKDPAILFNAGMAAFSAKDFAFASESWQQLKTVDPLDWHGRSKLIQAYQALGKTAERDKEREELFAMWKSGKLDELKSKFQYCRDQFEVNGKKVMAFEHFELKGDRAVRYVFSILNKTEDDEEFRISLGSYNLTNTVWRRTATPKPKDGERMFHLDGYFPNRHLTYGMFFPEPTYDETRAHLVRILERKVNPISGTMYPDPKPSPSPQ